MTEPQPQAEQPREQELQEQQTQQPQPQPQEQHLTPERQQAAEQVTPPVQQQQPSQQEQPVQKQQLQSESESQSQAQPRRRHPEQEQQQQQVQDDAGAQGLEDLQGQVKSFSQSKGFGFIECDLLRKRGITQDIFLHHLQWRQQSTQLQKGTLLTFSLVFNDKGQPQATDCRPMPKGQ